MVQELEDYLLPNYPPDLGFLQIPLVEDGIQAKKGISYGTEMWSAATTCLLKP